MNVGSSVSWSPIAMSSFLERPSIAIRHHTNHDWIGILHCAPGRRLEERQVRHAGMTRRTTYDTKPMALTTYPGILPLGTMDRRAPAITTSVAMNRRFVALSIVDQVCRVRGFEPCQPFRTGEPALFLCSPIPGSSTINNHYELTNLSGVRYYRSPNWAKARGYGLTHRSDLHREAYLCITLIPTRSEKRRASFSTAIQPTRPFSSRV